MVIYTWREVFEAVRGGKRRKKKRNAERKRSLKANASAEYEGGGSCAIFTCPYGETAVVTIPAIDFYPIIKKKKSQISQFTN